jgi:sec-independent protein translocase protein TatA
MRLGWPEMIAILVIILIIFGAGKLPEVGSAIGKGLRSFKKAQSGEDEEKEISAAPAKAKTKKVKT